MKKALKYLLSRTPYRISRCGSINRFQGQEDTFANLVYRGYEPDIIIDCGANTGAFSVMARRYWPAAHLHIVEPQPGCRPALDLVAKRGNVSIHHVALGDERGTLVLAAQPDSTSTGAHVLLDKPHADHATISVDCVTLDDLVAPFLTPSNRALLKLDLQGYELHALRGAPISLRSIEVVLTEVSFFAQAYEPPLAELIAFMDRHEFELHDIVALSGRRRDGRAHQGDFLFVKQSSALASDRSWG